MTGHIALDRTTLYLPDTTRRRSLQGLPLAGSQRSAPHSAKGQRPWRPHDVGGMASPYMPGAGGGS
jgi:hypothetical protein